MTKSTYTAHAEKGQGMTFGASVEIVRGWNAIVKRGTATVFHGPLYRTAEGAYEVAKRKAAEYRAYRQKHGEGLEDVAQRKEQERRTARRRRQRIDQKDIALYDLLVALASDCELVREWLPTQALKRLDQAKELIAFVETDPASKPTTPPPAADPTTQLGMLGPAP